MKRCQALTQFDEIQYMKTHFVIVGDTCSSPFVYRFSVQLSARKIHSRGDDVISGDKELKLKKVQ